HILLCRPRQPQRYVRKIVYIASPAVSTTAICAKNHTYCFTGNLHGAVPQKNRRRHSAKIQDGKPLRRRRRDSCTYAACRRLFFHLFAMMPCLGENRMLTRKITPVVNAIVPDTDVSSRYAT